MILVKPLYNDIDMEVIGSMKLIEVRRDDISGPV